MWNELNLRFYPYRQYLILDRHLRTPRLLHLKLYFGMFIYHYLIYEHWYDCFLLLTYIFTNQIFIYNYMIKFSTNLLHCPLHCHLLLHLRFHWLHHPPLHCRPRNHRRHIWTHRQNTISFKKNINEVTQSESNGIISYPSRYRRLGIRLKTFSL